MRDIYPSIFKKIGDQKVNKKTFWLRRGIRPIYRNPTEIKRVLFSFSESRLIAQTYRHTEPLMARMNSTWIADGYGRIPYHFLISSNGILIQTNKIVDCFPCFDKDVLSIHILDKSDNVPHVGLKNALFDIHNAFKNENLIYEFADGTVESPTAIFFSTIRGYKKECEGTVKQSGYFDEVWSRHMGNVNHFSEMSQIDFKSFIKHLFLTKGSK